MKSALLDKFSGRTATIGVVGIGYVGLPLAVAFAEEGFKVLALDVDADKAATINGGQSYIIDVPAAAVARQVNTGRLEATVDYGRLEQADAILICVPTPLGKTGDPDLSLVIAASDSIAATDFRGKLVVLESTTYPGTTEEVIRPRLEHDGHVIGKDVFLAFSPERTDPGRTDFTVRTTPKIVGGTTSDCLEVAMALYGTIVDQPVPVSSTAAAEMVKLLENTFRAVNIGLVNEVAMMCDRLGLDSWEIVQAASTKPYGFMPFYPGPGLGGHCIPVDPMYLHWKLRTLDYKARFIELADEVNGQMPEYVVSKVAAALNEAGRAVKGSKIVILGVAYKPNISDLRESPALDVIHLLQKRGALVTFFDPYVSDLSGEGVVAESEAELSELILGQAQCVVVITHHDDFDWDFIGRHSSLIVDTRHVIDKDASAKVIYL